MPDEPEEPEERRPRFRRQYDAGLHLLDRQIVDRDGALVAKVDDLELAQRADGRIAVSALLVGPGALGPRIGGRLGRWTVAVWRRLRPDADPSPSRIDAELVSGTESTVHLGAGLADLQRADAHIEGFERWMRQHVIDRIPGAGHADDEERSGSSAGDAGRGVLSEQPNRPPGGRYRLGALLGARIVLRDGSEVGHVNDVRLTGGPGLQTYVLDGLVVGPGSEGSMLGYDRREVRGPWLVRAIVVAANRDASFVPWREIRRIDWDAGCVEVERVEPLTDERPAS